MNELQVRPGGGYHLSTIEADSAFAESLRWQDAALCAQIDSEVFFPERGQPSGPALRICQMCPVQRECLEYALQSNVSGVWGNTTERQRQRMRGRRGGITAA